MAMILKLGSAHMCLRAALSRLLRIRLLVKVYIQSAQRRTATAGPAAG